jgi:bifunctional ADP-heptose synthase (sugar kinase/adenylyltransferase)
MLDCLVLGSVKRISPESTVPVLRAGKSEQLPGGAANVAALGGRRTQAGVVGASERGRSLAPSFDGTNLVVMGTLDLGNEGGRLRWPSQGRRTMQPSYRW